MSRSFEQAAENEATFRLANETLEERAAQLGFKDEPTPYLCECEDERCTEVLRLRREEYEFVRAHPRRFIVHAGHEETDERILLEANGFAVIDKRGEEGDLVAKNDPRATGS